MLIYIDHNYQALSTLTDLTRGDDLHIDLVLLDERREAVRRDLDEVVFAAKGLGDYKGKFILYTNKFEPSVLPDGRPCLSADIALSVKLLTDIIGNNKAAALMGQFEFHTVGMVASTQPLPVVILNDIIKDFEGIDEDTVPTYVTKEYVDSVIRDKLRVVSPVIGNNGNWWIHGEDTHVAAVTDLSECVKFADMPALLEDALQPFATTHLVTEQEYTILPEKRAHSLYFTVSPNP